jgi:hypothetical protein
MTIFGVSEAMYINTNDQPVEIVGIPEPGNTYFGTYTGEFSKAASKAFTGLHKFMKKYAADGWFPEYEVDNPPDIIFTLIEVDPKTKEVFRTKHYYGSRVLHRQGPKTIVSKDGRVRHYIWDNKIIELE